MTLEVNTRMEILQRYANGQNQATIAAAMTLPVGLVAAVLDGKR